MSSIRSAARRAAGIALLLCAAAARASDGPRPITLNVDAREAPLRIFHARLVIPAAPGPLTLVYPKWIPGEHGPTGPITDLADADIFPLNCKTRIMISPVRELTSLHMGNDKRLTCPNCHVRSWCRMVALDSMAR